MGTPTLRERRTLGPVYVAIDGDLSSVHGALSVVLRFAAALPGGRVFGPAGVARALCRDI